MSESLAAQVAALDFDLPRMPERILTLKAIKHHNQIQKAKAARLDDLFSEPQYLNDRSHPNALHMAEVNYLKSYMEKKYPLWGQLLGQTVHFEAYALGKNKILEAIQKEYPHLETACLRQMV